MSISFESKGDFKNTRRFLAFMRRFEVRQALHRAGRKGVSALSAGTPVDSGITAGSWGYEIRVTRSTLEIEWTNNEIVAGVPLVILLQYGHGTGTGGWVAGRDFINPAIRPVLDEIAEDVWKVVTSA